MLAAPSSSMFSAPPSPFSLGDLAASYSGTGGAGGRGLPKSASICNLVLTKFLLLRTFLPNPLPSTTFFPHSYVLDRATGCAGLRLGVDSRLEVLIQAVHRSLVAVRLGDLTLA